MEEDVKAVVLDSGSGFCKAGFAGDDRPYTIIPSIIGTDEEGDSYIGDEAQSRRDILDIQYPIDRGIVTDWDIMEMLWDYTFNTQMKIATSEHPLLATEDASNPKKNREKMTEIMFGTFQAPAFYAAIHEVLSLYASGRTTGVVVESGDGLTNVVTVYEGFAIPHAVQRLELGGRDITESLNNAIAESSGITFSKADEYNIVRDIKEQLCYVAFDYENDAQITSESSDLDMSYELPDGQVITLSQERFSVPEALFQPSYGVHEMTCNSIKTCDFDIRKDLYENIVLCGGNTMFSGFSDRLDKEIRALNTSLGGLKIVVPEKREYAAWLGGSLLSSLTTFQNLWISKEEYEDAGASIIHRKCF